MQATLQQRPPADDLRSALQQVLSQYYGRPRQVQKLRRRRSIYSSSYTIENLEVELDRGQRLSLVFKDLSPTSLLTTAQEVRPRFYYDPMREIETYRRILNPKRFGTAICYGAVHHPRRQQYWLFLERVKGPLLWQVGRMESWRQAVRWLARLHNQFDEAHHPRPATAGHLLNYDRHLLDVWVGRAELALRSRSSSLPAGLGRKFRHLADRYDQVIDRLLALPRTFVHGEFYPSNILLRAPNHRERICPIDWEVAALAPRLIDLAALTSGDWTTEQRHDFVATYRQAWNPRHGSPPPMPELLEAVDCCQLHLCMQWLGWARDWSPPRMHARNWLREAIRLGERLGL